MWEHLLYPVKNVSFSLHQSMWDLLYLCKERFVYDSLQWYDIVHFYTLVKNVSFTTLHNGMISSTLNISSHGFALGFPKGLVPMKIVFFDYKPRIIP